MLVSLGWIDTVVLFAALAVAIAIGLRARGKNDSVEAFLLGSRDLPWWAILGSIVATETSTATVLSLPAEAYGPTGMKFLQIALGYILGRTIVVHLLLPLYFKGKLFSAYEVLGKRFGVSASKVASILFLVTRNLGDGLRLFLAAIVLQKLVGWPFIGSALAIGGITILYTYFGGMRSVVWNDCVQLVVYMLGGIVTLFILAKSIPGGWDAIGQYATANDKLQILNWWPDESSDKSLWYWILSEPYTIWAGLIGGAVLTLGTHGTDQMMVQRYLSARNQKEAGRAVLISAFVVLVQFALFLFIGVQLACYYSNHPEVVFEKSDEVYAHFIVNHFPQNTGLVGLMLAAILAAAMSTLSSSLNASASALVNDFYLPGRETEPDPKSLLRITRRLCIVFGLLQVGIGILATTFDKTVVSNALAIAGFSAGLLLGLFLLAVLTPRVRQAHALLGAACGLMTLLFIQFVLPQLGGDTGPGTETFRPTVAWPWFALIGSSVTLVVGWLASLSSSSKENLT